MRSELLAIADLGEREVERWRELAQAAAEPNPFFEPGFVLPAAAALGASPQLLVAVEPTGDWAGAVPVLHERGWRRMPLRGFSSWRHLYSFFGAPLLRTGEEAAALHAWLTSSQVPLRPYLGLDLLDRDGPVMTALTEVAAATDWKLVEFDRHERAALRRLEDGTLSLRTSAKRRRETERLGRRLGDKLGGDVEAVDRAVNPAAVEDFLALEASGWKGAAGTAFANQPSHAEFFRRLCGDFRDRGRLQMLSLQADGHTAAMKCDLVAGNTVFGFKIAFDETLAEFSPGIQLERHLVDYVSDDESIDLIDTCAEPGNAMANRVWPDRRSMISLAVVSPGLLGSISTQSVRGLALARNTIRRSP